MKPNAMCPGDRRDDLRGRSPASLLTTSTSSSPSVGTDARTWRRCVLEHLRVQTAQCPSGEFTGERPGCASIVKTLGDAVLSDFLAQCLRLWPTTTRRTRTRTTKTSTITARAAAAIKWQRDPLWQTDIGLRVPSGRDGQSNVRLDRCTRRPSCTAMSCGAARARGRHSLLDCGSTRCDGHCGVSAGPALT